jgi:23S rRNA (uracil1939-C5)-methyltransferase
VPSLNTILHLTIERLSLGGEGVGRSEGRVVFVPYTVPGDLIEAEITDTQPRFARARLLRVLQASPQRIVAPCPYHFQPPGTVHPGDRLRVEAGVSSTFFCGGCSWQQIAYEGQLSAKREIVRETLERLGGLRGVAVEPTLGMKDPWRYRNKVQPPVGWDAARKRMISGFYTPSSHDIVPIEDCWVQPELSVSIVSFTRDLLGKQGLRAYDEANHTGWVRHLIVRTNEDASQAMLTFVTRTPEFPREQEIVVALAEQFPAIVGVYQNVQPARSNVILGRHWRTLAGQEGMEERLGRLRFRQSPAAFFQVNTRQAERLYDVARAMAGTGERLLDLYCGVGGIALWLADHFKEVGGVEEIPAAIRDAEANAALNGITNTRFTAKPVEDFLRKARPDMGRGLTVTLDPPRAGCSPEVLRGLMMLEPDRIVYISCDPGTLARDLAGLVKTGYRVEKVQPVDLFPQTSHIETAVKLIKQ